MVRGKLRLWLVNATEPGSITPRLELFSISKGETQV
jgi:hypothetical protein